ncbi:hypothetical protein M011DRAFT_522826 [Sporormia fimetaria CBS 119925]|uniref:Uncharacterized protein n=1 Tax=Sporormia fimetaria CBS 119925 TaxID=1340428 RepID=A0A6A6VQ32_9PLEO|nr:hypothetical protein M011DRAFT_522826 [Sporormia fimetaria CBS 119925]
MLARTSLLAAATLVAFTHAATTNQETKEPTGSLADCNPLESGTEFESGDPNSGGSQFCAQSEESPIDAIKVVGGHEQDIKGIDVYFRDGTYMYLGHDIGAYKPPANPDTLANATLPIGLYDNTFVEVHVGEHEEDRDDLPDRKYPSDILFVLSDNSISSTHGEYLEEFLESHDNVNLGAAGKDKRDLVGLSGAFGEFGLEYIRFHWKPAGGASN